LSGSTGDAINSIVEGYSKVDFGATVLSAIFFVVPCYLHIVLNWTSFGQMNVRVITKWEEDQNFYEEEEESVV
jgi:hypothetical protein